MFQDGPNGTLRFAVDEDRDGQVLIRVLPKRGKQGQADCATPRRERPRLRDEGHRSRGARAAPRGPGGHGLRRRSPTPPRPRVKADPHHEDRTAPEVEPGLAPLVKSEPTGGGGSRGSGLRVAGDRGAGKDVGDWVSWVLRTGHREL